MLGHFSARDVGSSARVRTRCHQLLRHRVAVGSRLASIMPMTHLPEIGAKTGTVSEKSVHVPVSDTSDMQLVNELSWYQFLVTSFW